MFDDHALLEGSTFLRGTLGAIWRGAGTPDYGPLTWSSLWLDLRLLGGEPAALHAVNLCLHALTALLIWRVLRALEVPWSWLGAALFAVHPVAVDSVAWISERKNVLSGALCAGSVLLWVRYDARGRARDLAGAIALFALALLAKTSIVAMPVVLLGIVLWRRGGVPRSRWLASLPFFGLSAVAGVVTMWFQWTRAIEDHLLRPRGLAERLGGAGWALTSYLERAFLPVRVGFVYADWPVGPRSALFWAPLLVVLLSAALVVRFRRGWGGPVLLALAYHALLVAPVLGLLDMAYFGVGPVANHLQYLALVGPSALVAAGLAQLGRRRRAWAVAAGAALIGLLLSTSFRRAASFESDFTLWQTAARGAPDNLFAVWMYADALGEAGRGAEALAELDRAGREARDEHVRLRARGLAAAHQGDAAAALEEARWADALRPDAEYALELGRLLARSGHAAEAAEVLRPLVAAAPGNASFRYWLAVATARQGRREEALELLPENLRRVPADDRSRKALELLAPGPPR